MRVVHQLQGARSPRHTISRLSVSKTLPTYRLHSESRRHTHRCSVAEDVPVVDADVVATDDPRARAATPQITYDDRVIGSLLGAACGDVLGHPLEGLGPGVIAGKCPHGNRDFYLKESWELAGMYSGDTQLMLGIAQSLVNTGAVNAEDIATCQVASYKLLRGYREWDQRVMDALAEGDDCRETGRKFLLGGWSLSGAAKIAPVGLAYREANNVALLMAVKEAIVMTHTHQAGIEAAFVQALAVKALARGGPETMSPTAFLKHLMDRCREEDMKKRIKLMLMWAPHVRAAKDPHIQDWQEFLRSDNFNTIMKVRRMIAEEKQMKGSQAVACALWALCCCWEAPEDAVVCSTHLGGYTHSIAAMTGALAGAQHGRSWLPGRWLDNLENGPGGRDAIIALGQQLAQLDIRS